jgi:arylsulfatase A-like enzyme
VASATSRNPLSARFTLALAIWCGLAVGLAEAATRAALMLVPGRWASVSPHVVWMAPTFDAALFAATGLVLSVLALAWPRLRSLPVAVLVFVFLGLLGPLLFVPRLHPLAGALLAAGLAAQAARLLGRRALLWETLLRRTTPVLVAAILLGGAAVAVWPWFEERRARTALAAGPTSAPNVLLVVLDTVRAKSMSLYGYPRPTTPVLKRLADRGVVFERALATSSWTLPSHASMFTGRYPHELSANWLEPLDGAFPTLAETFRDHGYLTAGFTANLLYTTRETGLARGFLRYEDYPVSIGMVVHSSFLGRWLDQWLLGSDGHREALAVKPGDWVTRAFLHWLDGRGERPFFAFLNYMDAHAPYVAPASFAERFGPTRRRPPVATRRAWTSAQIQVEVDAYDGCLAYLDQQIGQLVDELGRRGVLDRTLLVVVSDHGELFGEHRLFDHGNSLYRPLLQVPLVIVYPPRVPAGVRVTTPVTLRDLAATVVDLAPLPRASRYPGVSLTTHWTSPAGAVGASSPLLAQIRKNINQDPWLPASQGDMQALVANGHYYIRNGDGREELYDFDRDPGETRDLAATDEGQAALAAFRRSLAALSGAGKP